MNNTNVGTAQTLLDQKLFVGNIILFQIIHSKRQTQDAYRYQGFVYEARPIEDGDLSKFGIPDEDKQGGWIYLALYHTETSVNEQVVIFNSDFIEGIGRDWLKILAIE